MGAIVKDFIGGPSVDAVVIVIKGVGAERGSWSLEGRKPTGKGTDRKPPETGLTLRTAVDELN